MANPRFKENKLKRFIAKSLQPIIRLISKKKYISLQYRYITGHKLDWKNLNRYTEKLQYLRLYYYPKTEAVIRATSRIGARTRVYSKGHEHLLISVLGMCNKVEQIKFDKLPDKFVIKATHASGLNYICLDKNSLDIVALKKKLRKWLKTDYGAKTVEPHYSKIKPGLIIEEFVGENNTLPIEFKIHVFNGKARYLYVVSNRGRDIRYDNLMIDFSAFDGAQFNHWSKSDTPPVEPKQFREMVTYAEELANDLLFCRVDFFLVNGKIYFNEFTFTPAKGTLIFDDDQADFKIGEWLDISSARPSKGTSLRKA